jgi:tripartite-type tricarboxylate transporter receptor subunit TctC
LSIKNILIPCLAGFLLALSSLTQAQDWPTRPVKIVVPYPAGGGVDVLARALANQLQEKWHQTVTIDNRPGANTLIGAEMVAHASDGQTLLLSTDATFTINPHLYNKLPYDPLVDFKPITQLVSFSQLLIVNSKLGINQLQDLIAQAKAHPNALSYASYGPGSQPQLATEMLKQKAHISIEHISYKGIPQAVMAVVSGEIAMTWSGVVSARAQLLNKSIIALAYGGRTRLKEYPNVATVAELGFPEIDANVWVGVFAPASFSASSVEHIHSDIRAVISTNSFREKEIEGKAYDFAGLNPEEFKSLIQSESLSRAALIKSASIKLNP